MKTTTLIMAGLCLTLQMGVRGQEQNKQMGTSTVKVISVPHADYVSDLLKEVDLLNDKADHLRAEAKKESGEKQKKLNREASVLENRSLEKQIEVFEINYANNDKLYTDNEKTIRQMQKKTNSKQNGMHLEYLLTEAVKNIRLADELAEESNFQSNLALRMGNLENAEEKMLTALKQQGEALEILKSNSKMVAHR
ncbi:MAG: hypothetical protein PSX36_03010 [bacterium]|nr:hypothetical protein [bacterium]